MTTVRYPYMEPSRLVGRGPDYQQFLVSEGAIELDRESAEAYTRRGCGRSAYDWSWSDAEDDFHRAIDANASYPTAHH
jgi:hypothetical protein